LAGGRRTPSRVASRCATREALGKIEEASFEWSSCRWTAPVRSVSSAYLVEGRRREGGGKEEGRRREGGGKEE